MKIEHLRTGLKLCVEEDDYTKLRLSKDNNSSCIWNVNEKGGSQAPLDLTKPKDDIKDDDKKAEDKEEEKSGMRSDRVDASTEIVGMSSKFINYLRGKRGEDAEDFNIKLIIKLYKDSKTLYDTVMQAYLKKVYDNHAKTDPKSLTRDEALDYLYDVLDVKRQQKQLAIAKAAASIAGDDDYAVDKSEMENFLYDLFTDKFNKRSY